MKFLFTSFVFLLVFNTSVFAKDFEEIEIEISSKIAKHTLKFELTLPNSYESWSSKKYPVLITTAGQSRVDVLRAQVDWLSHVNFAPIPEVILITMPEVKVKEGQDKFDLASGSLYEITAKVLLDEVLPYIDKNYRTTGYRIVEGFSSFGNFPLYLLRHHSDEINSFFVFSPALELDKSNLVGSFSDTWSLSENRSHYVYLSLGSFKNNRPHFEKVQQGLNKMKSHSNLVFDYADMSEENYLSGPNIGLVKASQLLFADLQPSYKQFHKSGVAGLTAYFNKLANKYHEEIELSNKLVDLSFSYSNAGLFNEAVAVMEEVIAGAEDSYLYRLRLAQIQMKADDKANASKNLKLALKLATEQQNQEAVEYINKQIDEVNQS